MKSDNSGQEHCCLQKMSCRLLHTMAQTAVMSLGVSPETVYFLIHFLKIWNTHYYYQASPSAISCSSGD